MGYLFATGGDFSAHRIGVGLEAEILIISLGSARNDIGVEAAVGTTALTKGNVEIDHALTEQELGLAEESLRRVSLDRIDTGLV